MSKVAKAIKEISSLKENNLRKLQEANESAYFDSQSGIEMDSSIHSVIPTTTFEDISTKKIESTTKSVQDTSSEISYSTNIPETNSTEKKVDNQPENISAIAENLNVSLEKPVSLKLKTTDNQDAKIQFIKFFGFNAKNDSRKASFNVYFYFIGRSIAKKIIMRLRIKYFRLTDIAESARTICTIANSTFAGTFASVIDGKRVNYNCEVNATLENALYANYSLNSDVPLILMNDTDVIESLDFSELNFNGNSVSESNSIHDNNMILNGIELRLNSTVASVEKYVLKLTGESDLYNDRLLRRLEVVGNLTVAVDFLDIYNNTKRYICPLIFNDIGDIERDELICNTSGNPINTTARKLDLSPGTRDGYLLLIKMRDFNSTKIISTDYHPKADTTAPTQAENASATVEDYTVNSDKPVSQKGHKTDDKDSKIHIMKFHSFQTRAKKINFHTIFYFIGKVIPYKIIYRLRITYNTKLRNLQTGTAESVQTDCIITNKDLAEKTVPDGVYVNYNCSANANGDSTISNIQLNTDVNMVFAYENGTIKEEFDFNQVSFDGIASEESKNIQENKETIKSQAYLKNTTVSIGKYYILKFTGKFEEKSLRRRLALSNGKNISMNFKTKKNNQNVTLAYNCDFYQANKNAELQCDTASNPIDTTIENLHLSNGQSDDGTFFTIEMLNWKTNRTRIIFENLIVHSKSSGGLSGGAIAAIVIPCVVVLVAVALITIIVLRKHPLNQPAALDRNYDSSAHVIN
jgi:hypothetical protein